MGIESRENDTETLIFLKNGRNKEKKISPGFEPGTSGTKEKCSNNRAIQTIIKFTEIFSFINYYEENKGQKAKNFAKGLIHPDMASK